MSLEREMAPLEQAHHDRKKYQKEMEDASKEQQTKLESNYCNIIIVRIKE